MAGNEELRLSFEWGGLRLGGSLHLPDGPGPYPAALMAQGSGPADRDSGGYFVPIRSCFLDRGIATFAFDKPGCGESTGDWREYALGARAEQLLTALELIRDHPAIRGQRVGLWGHSQGGWLTQKIAGGTGKLDFAIANSAPTLSVKDQVVYDCEQTIRNAGFSAGAVTSAVTLARSIQDAAARNASFESIQEDLLKPASEHDWFTSFATIDEPMDWHHLAALLNEPHDPNSDLERVSCPFLAVYGGLDALLPPWSGAEESGKALTAADNTDATVVVFPGGNHRIQESETREFVTGYLDLLGDWVAHRAFNHENSSSEPS